MAVSAVFAYLAIQHVRFNDVWSGLRECSYWWLLPAFAALVVANVLRGVRWQYLFAPETRPPYRHVLSAMLLGQFFNNILPGRAGEAARIVAINQSCGTSRVEAAGTVVSERVWDVLSLLALLFVAVPWLPNVTWLRTAAILLIVVVAGTVITLSVLAKWSERSLLFVLRPLTLLPFVSSQRTATAAANLVHGLVGLRRVRLVFVAFLLSVVSWLVLDLSAWFVLQSSHLDLPFGAALLTYVAVGFGMTLPASPANIGVFEAATIVALRAYHVPDSQALSYALILHTLNFFPYIAAGLLILQGHAISARRTRLVSKQYASGD
jgi:uncharacterized protein (TIRG00374 family)